jgi:hypothetical protein
MMLTLSPPDEPACCEDPDDDELAVLAQPVRATAAQAVTAMINFRRDTSAP